MNLNVKLDIQEIINNLPSKSLQEFDTYLRSNHKNISLRNDYDSDLAILTNNYNKNKKLNKLESECRSIILDKNTLDIVCYTHDDIIFNENAKSFLLKNDSMDKKILECYEGTTITVFNYKQKWFFSTRKCIDSKKSKWNSDKSYYDLFLECLKMKIDDLTSKLNQNYIYTFVLVHHENQHIIDYSFQFGENYKEIIHIMTREQNTFREIELTDETQWTNSDVNFKRSKELDDLSILDKYNNIDEISLPLKSEGVIIKLFDSVSGKSYLLKIQNNTYQFLSMIKPNEHKLVINFVHLYKTDMLKKHIEFFPTSKNIVFAGDTFETINLIDTVFKVLTSEMFELFKHFYDFKSCSHKNSSLYDILPKEYRYILYQIRGIYFKKKEEFITNNLKNKSTSYVYSNLRIYDIYNLLKTYEIKNLVRLFNARIAFENTMLENQANTIIFKSLQKFNNHISNNLLSKFLQMLQ